MEDIRRFERENTVDATNQLPNSERFFSDVGRGGLRVLFVGNSITLHAPKPDIGWTHLWGMAASSRENDYVHQTMKLIHTLRPDADFCAAQLASWERGYWHAADDLESVRAARDWKPDIVVIRLGENTLEETLREHPYAPALIDMMNFFTRNGESRLVVTDLFWPNPAKDAEIRKAAETLKAPLVHIGDLGMRDDMKAVGLFEHAGVAAHPGDLGMKTIAERLFDVIKTMI